MPNDIKKKDKENLMRFWTKCRRCMNSILITFMTMLTLGVTCGVFLTAILVMIKLPLTELDTTILTWLIVAFCISVVVFFYALIIQFLNWKYSKLFIGIIFAIFDLFLLFCGLAIFTLRPKIINDIGTLWSKTSSQSSIARYFESYYNCCGFDENTNLHCNLNNQTDSTNNHFNDELTSVGLCKDAIISSVNFLGIVIIILFSILLIVVIFTFVGAYRQLKHPEDPELTEMQQSNYNDPVVWY